MKYPFTAIRLQTFSAVWFSLSALSLVLLLAACGEPCGRGWCLCSGSGSGRAQSSCSPDDPTPLSRCLTKVGLKKDVVQPFQSDKQLQEFLDCAAKNANARRGRRLDRSIQRLPQSVSVHGKVVVLEDRQLKLMSLDDPADPVILDSVPASLFDSELASVSDSGIWANSGVIYVATGFNYWKEAFTELNSFQLVDGKLARGTPIYFEGALDFGSSSDAQFVESKLFLSTINPALARSEFEVRGGYRPNIPQILELNSDSGKLRGVRPLVSASEVYVPIEADNILSPQGLRVFSNAPEEVYLEVPWFHTTLGCKLTDLGTIDCAARALISSAIPSTRAMTSGYLFMSLGDYLYSTDFKSFEVKAHRLPFLPTKLIRFEQDNTELRLHLHSSDSAIERKLGVITLPLADFNLLGNQEVPRIEN